MKIYAYWVEYMDAYRLFDPKHPEQTIAYEEDLDEAESRGYEITRVSSDITIYELYS